MSCKIFRSHCLKLGNKQTKKQENKTKQNKTKQSLAKKPSKQNTKVVGTMLININADTCRLYYDVRKKSEYPRALSLNTMVVRNIL